MARELVVVRVRAAQVTRGLTTIATTGFHAAPALKMVTLRIGTLRGARRRHWTLALCLVADWIPLSEISHLAALASWRCACIPTTRSMARELVVVRVRTAHVTGGLATISATCIHTTAAIETNPARISTLEGFLPHCRCRLLL